MNIDNSGLAYIYKLLNEGEIESAIEELEYLPIIPPRFGQRLLSRVLVLSQEICKSSKQEVIIQAFLSAFAEDLSSYEIDIFKSTLQDPIPQIAFLEVHELFFEICDQALDYINKVDTSANCEALTILARSLGKIWRPTLYDNWATKGASLELWARNGDKLKFILRNIFYAETPLLKARGLDAFSNLILGLYHDSNGEIESAIKHLQFRDYTEERIILSKEFNEFVINFLNNLALKTKFLSPEGEKLFSVFQATSEVLLSLFAIARVDVGESDFIYIGETFFVEAGISREIPNDFEGEPFDLQLRDPNQLISFDIVLHVNDRVELLNDWHHHLQYSPFSLETSLVKFVLRAKRLGPIIISLDYYHKKRWLRTIRFEFPSITLQPKAEKFFE